MKTKILCKYILLSTERPGGWFPEILYPYKNMGTSFTNMLVNDGKHLQLTIKYIPSNKYIILSLQI